VRFDTAKVAMSAGPLGTVCGVQLADVFQSPVAGFMLQVALLAKLLEALRITGRVAIAASSSDK
jgi:hypothetical protein